MIQKNKQIKKKIGDINKKIPNSNNLVSKTSYTKAADIENKIPDTAKSRFF